MHDDARKVYKPAPVAGQVKCPKCGRTMMPSPKNAQVSVCACGNAVKRVKMG